MSRLLFDQNHTAVVITGKSDFQTKIHEEGSAFPDGSSGQTHLIEAIALEPCRLYPPAVFPESALDKEGKDDAPAVFYILHGPKAVILIIFQAVQISKLYDGTDPLIDGDLFPDQSKLGLFQAVQIIADSQTAAHGRMKGKAEGAFLEVGPSGTSVTQARIYLGGYKRL